MPKPQDKPKGPKKPAPDRASPRPDRAEEFTGRNRPPHLRPPPDSVRR